MTSTVHEKPLFGLPDWKKDEEFLALSKPKNEFFEQLSTSQQAPMISTPQVSLATLRKGHLSPDRHYDREELNLSQAQQQFLRSSGAMRVLQPSNLPAADDDPPVGFEDGPEGRGGVDKKEEDPLSDEGTPEQEQSFGCEFGVCAEVEFVPILKEKPWSQLNSLSNQLPQLSEDCLREAEVLKNALAQALTVKNEETYDNSCGIS